MIEKLSVLSMTVGLIFFTLADSKVYPNFEIYGVVLVCSALVADALIGNIQEKTMKLYESTNTEMIIYSYLIGFVYILIYEIFYFESFYNAISFCAQVSSTIP